MPTFEKIARLESTGTNSNLRWATGADFSLRAYEDFSPAAEGFCVSTRSAELTFVIEGETTISIGPSGQTSHVKPGGYALIAKGTPHTSSSTPGTKSLIVDVFEDMGPSLAVACNTKSLSLAQQRELERVWENLLRLSSSELSRSFTRLRRHLTQLSYEEMEREHSTRRLLTVKTELERSFLQPVSIDSVASKHGMNRFYLTRSFKRNFGASPRAYVQRLRGFHLLWLLLEAGPANLAHTAASCGFGDYSTLCRWVKNRYGKPPSQLVTV
jgi:AraC-like DNA-binding protein/mannose-6-phosphate isomerase-like protein (cupin superfamily)